MTHTWGDYAWDAVAGASGAGLGFIFGDIPGAIAGAEFAGGYTHLQHPDHDRHRIGLNPNKRQRVNTNLPPLPTKTVTMPPIRSKRRAAPRKVGGSKRKGYKKKSSAAKRGLGRKRARTSRSGGRTLSGSERRQVKKIALNAVTADLSKGTMIHACSFAAFLVQEQQVVLTVDNLNSQLNHFTPRKLMSVASSMFNAMPHAAGYVFNSTNVFPADTKVHVIDSHVDYHCKNDSTMLYHVDVYEWEPTLNRDNVSSNTPLAAWNSALAQFNYQGNTTLSPASGAVQNQLFQSPMHVSAGFKDLFKVKKVKTMVMMPGTYADFRLQGPKNRSFNMKNYAATPVQLPAQGTVYNDYQHGLTKQVMFIIRTEPLLGLLAGAAVAVFPSNTSTGTGVAPNGFVGYYKEHWRLTAPPSTHTGTAGVAGTANPADNSMDYLGIFDYISSPGAAVTGIVLVQPENAIGNGLVA